MPLLQDAVTEQAAAKIGLFGPQGSGKTLTSMLLALGLSKTYHQGAPIAMQDTETGSDFIVDVAQIEGVPFKRFKSRAFKDMCAGLREAEEIGACVYIVDSYTHPWIEVNEALRKKKGVTKLQFHHMDELKSMWRTWTDLMLNSPCHVILSGRLGYVWDKEIDEETVCKAFQPHFAKLAINTGVAQRAVNPNRTSESLFDAQGDTRSVERMRKVTIVLEELEGLLVNLWPGQDALQKELKRQVIWTMFNTRSWTRVSHLSLETLERALLALRLFEEGTKEGPHAAALTDVSVATALIALCQKSVVDEAESELQTVGVI